MAKFDEPMAGRGKTPMENAYLTFVDEQRKTQVNWCDIPLFRDWVETQFPRIAELQSQLDAKWISVEERLPEATQGQVEGPFIISDDVLCYWPADGGIHEVCNYDHEDHRWSLVHKAFEEPDCEPTHWQPLPAPPSGAKGETKP